MLAVKLEIESKPIFEEHLPLLRKIVSEFVRDPQIIFEDTEEYADGCIGLISAINKYDPTRGKFSTIAYYCIRNEILSGLRKRKRHQLKTQSFDGFDPKDKKLFSSPEPTSQAIVWVEKLLSTCSDERNKTIVVEHYLKGKTFEEISQSLGISKQRVQQLAQKTLRQLKEVAEREDFHKEVISP